MHVLPSLNFEIVKYQNMKEVNIMNQETLKGKGKIVQRTKT